MLAMAMCESIAAPATYQVLNGVKYDAIDVIAYPPDDSDEETDGHGPCTDHEREGPSSRFDRLPPS